MENPNEEIENLEEKENEEVELNLENIEIKIQEVEVLIDKAEQEYSISNQEDDLKKYQDLRNEYKSLMKKRKELLKEAKNLDSSVLEQVSLWVVIFGVLSVIISLPILTGQLWLDFASKIMSLITNASLHLTSEDFLYKVLVFLIVFAFPLLINLITWFVHNNFVKKDTDKKVFRIFWIIQGVMSLGMIIYICIQLYA